MGHIFSLVLKSAWNRRLTLSLTMIAIMFSVTMLIGIERIRHAARADFSQTVSGTDLIIGARTGPVQLMLYSVFRIGEATNNIEWKSYEAIAARPEVAWAIPISLGDSHQGFAVLGTTHAYFEHFRYGASRPLTFTLGHPFQADKDQVFHAILGSEVAAKLGYRIGSEMTLSHGMSSTGLAEHTDKPFIVTGILASTGTPVDRTVHITLQGMEAIHLDWKGGAPLPGFSISPEYVRKFDLTPKQVTAVLVGLKNRASVFKVQRWANRNPDEPLLAVLPGVALDQLWEVIGTIERTLMLISGMVLLVGLLGLTAVILAGLNERRRELAILRSVGARPRDLFVMLTIESLGITIIGTLMGLTVLGLAIWLGGPLIESQFGLTIPSVFIDHEEIELLGAVIVTGLFASLVPGYRAYRLSLADGLTPRI